MAQGEILAIIEAKAGAGFAAPPGCALPFGIMVKAAKASWGKYCAAADAFDAPHRLHSSRKRSCSNFKPRTANVASRVFFGEIPRIELAVLRVDSIPGLVMASAISCVLRIGSPSASYRGHCFPICCGNFLSLHSSTCLVWANGTKCRQRKDHLYRLQRNSGSLPCQRRCTQSRLP